MRAVLWNVREWTIIGVGVFLFVIFAVIESVFSGLSWFADATGELIGAIEDNIYDHCSYKYLDDGLTK